MSSLDTKLLTLSKVAERLSIENNRIKVLKIMRNWRIPYVDVCGQKRIDPKDLERAIEENKILLGN